MELAERFAKNPADRTIVFMAFTGEEMGLLGSTHYVEKLFSSRKHILMLNLI
jgi:Zn-dependent M28 family amino/carboxypeptidase